MEALEILRPLVGKEFKVKDEYIYDDTVYRLERIIEATNEVVIDWTEDGKYDFTYYSVEKAAEYFKERTWVKI